MQTEGSIEIDRSIDDVYRFTVDHVAEWSNIVVEDELLKEHPDGVGTTFRSVTEDRGQRMVFEGVVTKHEPPYVHAIHLTGKMFDIEAAYAFEQAQSGTRVTQWSNVKGKGFFKVMLLLMGGLMKKSSCEALQKELESLKQFCEQQPADG